MNDSRDDLLRQLGAHARDHQQREASAPLDAGFHDRMAAQIQEQLASEAVSERHRSWRTGRRMWGAGLALAASVVAAVALTLTMVPRASQPELPMYSAQLRAGAAVRSGKAAAALEAGDQLDIVLRPTTAVAGSLRYAAYEMVDGELVPRSLPPARWSPDGAARIVTTIDDGAGFAPGSHELLLVVAHAGYMPDQAGILAAVNGMQDGGAAYRVVALTFEVAAP